MKIVELQQVVKRYESAGEPIEALTGVDFHAERGEMVCVIGPSGSGKSTLLNIMGLLDRPTEGTVFLRRNNADEFSEAERTDERRTGIGFIFEDFHLLPTLTAIENIEMPSMWNTADSRHDRALDLLTRVGLNDHRNRTPDQLSAGEKQQVAIARSLINEPHLVLADEATGNLDQETGRVILEELTRLKEEEDVAIVAASHDELVIEYADRVVELVDGEIQ